MAQKAFEQIREAETQAQAIIKNAQEEAAQIIKSAEEEMANAISRFSEICRQKALEKKKQTETAAQKNSMEFAAETTDLCAALKETLSLQKSKAVNAIIQVITT